MSRCEDYPCCGHTDGLPCDWVAPDYSSILMEQEETERAWIHHQELMVERMYEAHANGEHETNPIVDCDDCGSSQTIYLVPLTASGAAKQQLMGDGYSEALEILTDFSFIDDCTMHGEWQIEYSIWNSPEYFTNRCAKCAIDYVYAEWNPKTYKSRRDFDAKYYDVGYGSFAHNSRMNIPHWLIHRPRPIPA